MPLLPVSCMALIVAIALVGHRIAVSATRDSQRTFNGVFWEVKPYIYFDEQRQEIAGIYPTIFVKGLLYCNQSNDHRLVTYNVNLKSRKAFYDTFKSGTEVEGSGVLANITTPGNSLWFPYSFDTLKTGPIFLQRNLTVLIGLKSEGLAVLFPRSRIWLPYKIFNGVWTCRVIFMFALICSTFCGLILWFLERTQNPKFAEAGGPMTGLYWSFVTMTTVGYGDVVPITFIGRSLSVVWMFFGLMIASVLTATLTDAVTGIQGLEISGQRVAVLRNSHEERLTQVDYFAIPVLFDSYKEIIKAVQNKEVYAGVIPSDVASWMRHDFNNPNLDEPLEVVYELCPLICSSLDISSPAKTF